MDAGQQTFLRKRLRAAAQEQPHLKRLKPLLLRLGGVYLVAPPSSDCHLSAILNTGFVMSGPVKVKQMRSSMCHRNIAALWQKRHTLLIGIATGYALSQDDLWRQHSWGLMREGVLETTEVRLKYFGVLLQGSAADTFANENA